jgi:hypothetical protein
MVIKGAVLRQMNVPYKQTSHTYNWAFSRVSYIYRRSSVMKLDLRNVISNMVA